MNKKTIIAFTYDFDRTLSPVDMPDHKLTPELVGEKNVRAFWKNSFDLSQSQKVDSVLAYMYMLMQKGREAGKPITHELLRSCGEGIPYFPGVDTWFDRVNAYAKKRGAIAEHYIISSGLKVIVEGTSISKYFNRVYACDYLYDESGEAVWPRLAVNYTNKTQYLFRISKGAFEVVDASVNAPLQGKDYHVPFENMVYFGDGLTDVPCMSLLKGSGGHSVAVYTSETEEMAKNLGDAGRVNFVLPADYTEGSPVETAMFRLIDKIVADEALKKQYSKK